MSLKTIVRYYLIWQLALLLISAVAIKWLPLREGYLGGSTAEYLIHPLLLSRANFDGNHYLTIARRGYENNQRAFFPLYPQTISYLGRLIGNDLVAALLIANLSFFIAVVILVKLVELDYSPRIAKYTLISLLIFPASFFFGSVYSESLFLVLLLGSFYVARLGKWWIAGILGAVASYTRFIGVMIFPALLIELWQQSEISNIKFKIRNLIPLLLVPLGLVIYMYGLKQTVGDPLAFIHVQESFGQGRSDKIILLYQVFWRYGKMILTINPFDIRFLIVCLEALVGAGFLIWSVIIFAKQRLSYAIFSFLAYIVPTLTGNFVSLPRYVLVCFPAFVLMGVMLNSHPKLRGGVWAISAILLVVVMSVFVRGYWVA